MLLKIALTGVNFELTSIISFLAPKAIIVNCNTSGNHWSLRASEGKFIPAHEDVLMSFIPQRAVVSQNFRGEFTDHWSLDFKKTKPVIWCPKLTAPRGEHMSGTKFIITSWHDPNIFLQVKFFFFANQYNMWYSHSYCRHR